MYVYIYVYVCMLAVITMHSDFRYVCVAAQYLRPF